VGNSPKIGWSADQVYFPRHVPRIGGHMFSALQSSRRERMANDIAMERVENPAACGGGAW